MNKKALIISLISTFMGVLIIFLGSISAFIQIKNKSLFNNSYVVIYQCEVIDFNIDLSKEPVEVYREKFSKNLEYEYTFTSLNGKGTNTVVIKNGKIYISESSCFHKKCQSTPIEFKSIFKNTEIVCMPNGLIIKLEEVEK